MKQTTMMMKKKTDVLKETGMREGMRREEMCVCVNWERRGRES